MIFNMAGGASGTEIKEFSGSFRTNSSGAATINCGFKPDIIYIHKNEKDDQYLYSAAIAFAEENRSGTPNTALFSTSSTYYLYDIHGTASTNGATIYVYGLKYSDYSEVVISNTTFYYTAIKYTE